MTIAERIKTKRNELNLTQQDLANLVGMTQQSIAYIESGVINSPKKIFELSIALQCSVEWLCTGKQTFEQINSTRT